MASIKMFLTFAAGLLLSITTKSQTANINEPVSKQYREGRIPGLQYKTGGGATVSSAAKSKQTGNSGGILASAQVPAEIKPLPVQAVIPKQQENHSNQ